MSDQTVFVVTYDGPNLGKYPYGVFTNEQAAQEAREAIIAELDGMEQKLDDANRTLTHQLGGTLDEEVYIEQCKLRSEFSGDELQELFEDV